MSRKRGPRSVADPDAVDLQEAAVTQGVTAYCPTCRQDRPIEEFIEGNIDLSYEGPPPSCKTCRDQGLVPQEPEVMNSLNTLHRRILKALFLGKSYADAARLAGCSQVYVKNLVKNHGHTNEDFRRAFQMMLEVEGLDYHSLVRMAKVLFYSKEAKWNPTSEEWDYFPDNKTRLGTLRHLTKLRELDPPGVSNLPQAIASVQIVTNVGMDAEPRDAPGTFTVNAGPVVPAIPPEADKDE